MTDKAWVCKPPIFKTSGHGESSFFVPIKHTKLGFEILVCEVDSKLETCEKLAEVIRDALNEKLP